MKKRWFSILLSACICLSILPVAGHAAWSVSYDELTDYYWYSSIQDHVVWSFEENGVAVNYAPKQPVDFGKASETSFREDDLGEDTFWQYTYSFNGSRLIINGSSYYGDTYSKVLDLYDKKNSPAQIEDSFAARMITQYDGSLYFYETGWIDDDPFGNATYLVRLAKKDSDGQFKDFSSIRHTEAVSECVDLNIISGFPDGSFQPNGNVTRAQMAKMICVALNGGKEPTTAVNKNPTYADVDNHWAEGYIEYCSSKGIVAGIGSGKFNPDGNVTGTQAAKMLLVALGYNAEKEHYVGSGWNVFVDSRAEQVGLYDQLETMDPAKNLSRDNAAQMIWNALQADVVNSSGSSKGYTLLENTYGMLP